MVGPFCLGGLLLVSLCSHPLLISIVFGTSLELSRSASASLALPGFFFIFAIDRAFLQAHNCETKRTCRVHH
jgi:hypothetical protein